jgi:hypothetical protein
MKTPKVILRYMEEFEEQEEDVRQYILGQLAFFREIPDKATNEAGWLALKLGCSPQQASTAIRWATVSSVGEKTSGMTRLSAKPATQAGTDRGTKE